MSIDQDFTEFVAARWASLYRLAYLLAGSPTGAEDLLQTTLYGDVHELVANRPDGA
jgi:DNA-directed RNA polymerase specialized sigma24 family protein